MGPITTGSPRVTLGSPKVIPGAPEYVREIERANANICEREGESQYASQKCRYSDLPEVELKCLLGTLKYLTPRI